MTGMVVTVSAEWYKNVLIGITKGNLKVDYWTNGWIPQKKIDELEVYYDGILILKGTVDEEAYCSKPEDVFSSYKGKNLYTIGVEPQAKYKDFEAVLKNAFTSQLSDTIGNIVFTINSVSGKIIDEYEKRGISFPYSIEKITKEKEDNVTVHGRIVYKEN